MMDKTKRAKTAVQKLEHFAHNADLHTWNIMASLILFAQNVVLKPQLDLPDNNQ